jgi:hypothetical protein
MMKRFLTITALTALCLAFALPSTSSLSVVIVELQTEFSPEMEMFVEHLQDFYLYDISDPHIDYTMYFEKTLLIGFALGRQAINVKDDAERKRKFQKIEDDLLKLFVTMAIQMRKRQDGTYDETLVTKDAVEAWQRAQMAMMGFHDDIILDRFPIDTSKIPNMFNPWEAGGDAVAGVYEASALTHNIPNGTLILRGNMDRVEFEFDWGGRATSWTGVLKWDGKREMTARSLFGQGGFTRDQKSFTYMVGLRVEEGIDGKWRGSAISLGGTQFKLKERR